MTEGVKFSSLTTLAGANSASGDVFVVEDISASEVKKITRDELKIALGVQRSMLSVTSDVALAAGNNDIAALGSLTIPASGLITFDFTGRILDTSGANQDITLGLKIGSTYYYPAADDNGAGLVPHPMYRADASQYREFTGSGQTTLGRGARGILGIEAASLPTGSQTVTLAVYSTGTVTIQGATTTARFYVRVEEF